MTKKSLLSMLFCTCLALSSGVALASEEIPSGPGAAPYPQARADRPLTLNSYLSEAKLNLDLGLTKNRAAKDFGLGLGYSIGLPKQFEAGLAIQALSYGKDAQGTKFGGAGLYGRWAFLPYLGLQLDVYVPGNRDRMPYIDSFGDQLLGTAISLPAQAILIENHLKLHGALLVDLGFSKKAAGYSKALQLRSGLDIGLLANIIPAFWIDLATGYNAQLMPGKTAIDGSFKDRSRLPLALTLGTTLVDGRLDLGLRFATANLLETKTTGTAFASRSLTLTGAFRF